MIWLARLAMVLAGVGIMYLEGGHQPSPGVGFAVATGLILAAPLIGSRQ